VTEHRVQRRLAAILAADVVGYSALMQRAEEATYAEFDRLSRELIEPSLSRHEGRLIKTTGDGVLAEFASPLAAMRCAVEIQDHLASGSSPLTLRVGLNLGDVIVGADGDLFGDGINIAVRLEGVADPGGILISEKVYSEVEGKLDVGFEDRGEQQLKNISKPVRAYAVRAGAYNPLTERIGAAPPLPDKPSIAVLPFQNMSGDPEQEYFADGMVEDIITGLSRSKSLFVIARTSSFAYKGKAVDVKQVGRELGIRYVLEGSIRKSGNRVRITGQLVDAATGNHIWADRYDSTLEDIFDVQDRVTMSVIGAMTPQLERAEIARAQRKPTESLQAYDYHLRALASSYRYTREANIEALKLTQMANNLDPNFARPFALAADCLVQRWAFGWSAGSAEDVEEARRLARRAIEIDKDDPTALALAGMTLAVFVGEVEDGAALLTRAITFDPNLAVARIWNGFIQLGLGNQATAIEQFQIGLRLSPLDPRIFIAQTGMAAAHFLAGRYEDGCAWAKIAVQQNPNFVAAHRNLVACHAMAGRIEEARQAWAVARQIDPTQRISTGVVNRWLRRRQDVQRYTEAFRIAGMPE
jgi:TolB-like protein/class 3 adenylate cyclase/Flp pilus assembly protein TadD